MAVDRLPYSKFKSFSRFFSAYTGEFDRVSSYFVGDYRDPRQRGQIAMQVADQFEFRRELTEVLLEQSQSFRSGEASIRNIDRLSGTDAVAVVTGQQVGLFSGPMYTLYKAITAIQLARRIEEDTGRPTIPVFWLEGEDHDLEEVSSTAVFADNEVQRIRYASANSLTSSAPVPVGRIVFDGGITESIASLENLLPPTEFRESLLREVREAYHPGATFLDSFARLMGHFFKDEGLVFVSGDDTRLKRLALPVFQKELKEHAKSAKLLVDISKKLSDSFHAQVRSDPTNLFLINEDGRHSLVAEKDEFHLKGMDERFDLIELLDTLENRPESFSPNVVLRPLFQDSVLPTAAYVAGPGEIAYLAQFKPIYEWAGVPMPIIYPRASITLVEPKIRKALEKYDVRVPAFEEQLDKMFHSIVVDAMDIDTDAIFERAGRHIHDAVNTIGPAIEAVDQSMRQAGEATRTALMKEWNRLRDRVVKAEKRRHEQTREQLAKTQTHLFPDGGLQERLMSPLYFMNKYGTDFVDRLLGEIDLDTTEHQILSL